MGMTSTEKDAQFLAMADQTSIAMCGGVLTEEDVDSLLQQALLKKDYFKAGVLCKAVLDMRFEMGLEE